MAHARGRGGGSYNASLYNQHPTSPVAQNRPNVMPSRTSTGKAPYKLFLRVHSCENLETSATHGSYCKVYVGEADMANGSSRFLSNFLSVDEEENADVRIFRTSTQLKNSVNPVWNEKFQIVIQNPMKEVLTIRVKSQHTLYANSIGACVVYLKQLHVDECMDQWFPLHKGAKQRACGRIRLQLMLSRTDGAPQSRMPSFAQQNPSPVQQMPPFGRPSAVKMQAPPAPPTSEAAERAIERLLQRKRAESEQEYRSSASFQPYVEHHEQELVDSRAAWEFAKQHEAMEREMGERKPYQHEDLPAIRSFNFDEEPIRDVKRARELELEREAMEQEREFAVERERAWKQRQQQLEWERQQEEREQEARRQLEQEDQERIELERFEQEQREREQFAWRLQPEQTEAVPLVDEEDAWRSEPPQTAAMPVVNEENEDDAKAMAIIRRMVSRMEQLDVSDRGVRDEELQHQVAVHPALDATTSGSMEHTSSALYDDAVLRVYQQDPVDEQPVAEVDCSVPNHNPLLPVYTAAAPLEVDFQTPTPVYSEPSPTYAPEEPTGPPAYIETPPIDEREALKPMLERCQSELSEQEAVHIFNADLDLNELSDQVPFSRPPPSYDHVVNDALPSDDDEEEEDDDEEDDDQVLQHGSFDVDQYHSGVQHKSAFMEYHDNLMHHHHDEAPVHQEDNQRTHNQSPQSIDTAPKPQVCEKVKQQLEHRTQQSNQEDDPEPLNTYYF